MVAKSKKSGASNKSNGAKKKTNTQNKQQNPFSDFGFNGFLDLFEQTTQFQKQFIGKVDQYMEKNAKDSSKAYDEFFQTAKSVGETFGQKAQENVKKSYAIAEKTLQENQKIFQELSDCADFEDYKRVQQKLYKKANEDGNKAIEYTKKSIEETQKIFAPLQKNIEKNAKKFVESFSG